jgi:hypothetical protein
MQRQESVPPILESEATGKVAENLCRYSPSARDRHRQSDLAQHGDDTGCSGMDMASRKTALFGAGPWICRGSATRLRGERQAGASKAAALDEMADRRSVAADLTTLVVCGFAEVL